MKIAVYTDSFLPARGGTEIATYNLCKELINLGHELILFCPDYHREQEFNEFPVYRVKSKSFGVTDKMVLRKLEYKRILRISKEFNPDIVYYCTASGMARMAVDIAKELNIPSVATIHTKFKDSFYNATHSHLIAYTVIKSLVNKLNRTDYVVCVSKDMADQLKEYGYKQDANIIKNGVGDFTSDNVQKEKEISNVYKFLFVGQTLKVKNIQFSLKALAYLKKNKGFNNFKFDIIGNGIYKQKLEKLTKKLDLEENVNFVGFVSDKKILIDYYSKANLFLIPSTFDNDALVILEASQNGTPTLALEGTGSSERIENNVNGFTSAYTIKDYAERIYEIVNNKDLYKNVCNNLASVFRESWKDVALKYEKIFIDLINKKNPNN